MKRVVVAMCLVGLLAMVVSAAGTKGTWTGWVGDEKCGAKINADCSKKCADAGAKMVFVTDTDKKVLAVANQDALKGHAGHHVKVTGTVDNGTLTIASISMMPEEKAASQ